MNYNKLTALCVMTGLVIALATAGCASLVSVLPLPPTPVPTMTPTPIPTTTPTPTEIVVAAAPTPTATPVIPFLPTTGGSNVLLSGTWVLLAILLAFGCAWCWKRLTGRPLNRPA